MINNLPKSWAVKNDGSQKFKDTVLAHINKEEGMEFFNGNSTDRYYGLSKDNEHECDKDSSFFDTILTIDEFINLTTMTIEEQIKALEERHRKEIDELKASLVKPKFEVGKWYFFTHTTINWLFNYKGVEDDNVMTNCAVNDYSGWKEASNNIDSYRSLIENKTLRPATKEEIFEALKKEAEKRGFKEGIKFIQCYHYDGNGKQTDIIEKHTDYVSGKFQLFKNKHSDFNLSTEDGDGLIFLGDTCKWAKIIQAPKLTFGGHEVTINGNEITCQDVVGTYEQLKKIYDSFNVNNLMFGNKKLEEYKTGNGTIVHTGNSIESWERPKREIKIGCTWGTMEEIKAILTAVELQKQ